MTMSASCVGGDRVLALGGVLLAGEDRRLDRRRDEHADADPLIVVRRRQPFREPDRGVLGHRVAHRVEDHQQSGRRRDVEQVAAALLEHVRDRVLRAPHLGHQIDVDDLLPLARSACRSRRRCRSRRWRPTGRSARSGRPWSRRGCAMSSSRPTSAATGSAPNRRGLSLAGLLTEIRQHDMRAVLREPRAQREADPAGAAGHDAHLVPDVHG